MVIELQIVSDIVEKATNKTEEKIVHKNVLIRKLFDINEIEVEEYMNPKNGKAVKRYSGIYSNESYYKINKPYSELRDIVINKTSPVKGFMGHTRKNAK